jgi:hypothetical protein
MATATPPVIRTQPPLEEGEELPPQYDMSQTQRSILESSAEATSMWPL